MNTKDKAISGNVSTERALDLALEALELNNLEWKALADSGDCGYWNAEDQDHYKQTNEAITAIKQARSAPYVATPLVPDALTDRDPETAEYREGWNDCRALMLNWRNDQ